MLYLDIFISKTTTLWLAKIYSNPGKEISFCRGQKTLEISSSEIKTLVILDISDFIIDWVRSSNEKNSSSKKEMHVNKSEILEEFKEFS